MSKVESNLVPWTLTCSCLALSFPFCPPVSEFCVVVAWLLVMVVAGIGIWGNGLGWELRRLVFGLGVDLLRVAEFVLFSPLGNP
jgi:hypothetical protein